MLLLDLTAAFDTIDHALLLLRLHKHYGIGGTVLQWFASYLHQRDQSVLINSSKSDPVTMEWGIPQGSIGGPILFVSYTAPVEDIIHAHGLSCIIYADDTQLYITMKSSERIVAIERIEQCIRDVKAWMTRNFLVLNDSETEVLHFTSRFAKEPPISNIIAGEAVVGITENARELGVILDSHLTLKPQVNNITRSASFALKKISSIRKYVDRHSCEKLVHAFILVLTTVLAYSSTFLIKILANYNASRTLRLVLLHFPGNATILPLFCLNFIGCLFSTG